LVAVPVRREQKPAFVTLDGSEVRELVQVGDGARNLSVAEAVVPAGGATIAHRHHASEEIYVFTAGSGTMRLGEERFDVRAGDCVLIAPGTPHKLWNPGPEPLVVLCSCAPPYADADTELLENAAASRGGPTGLDETQP
jgi:mannose-6-phosphate isomerase-like protein (cupin superfamily)